MEETPLRERPADGLTIQECWVDWRATENELAILRMRQTQLHIAITALENNEALKRLNPDRSKDQGVKLNG